MKVRFGILLSLVMLASFSRVLAQGTTMTWTVDGVSRTALVFAPKPTAAGYKVPLVFAFHGHGGNMQAAAMGMHLQTLWPEAVIVYPQGLNTPSTVDPQGLHP